MCCPRVCASDLGLVPFLSLGDVLGGDALVLHADVPESSCQVGFGHVHLDLHLSVLHLALQLVDLLQSDTTDKTVNGLYNFCEWDEMLIISNETLGETQISVDDVRIRFLEDTAR